MAPSVPARLAAAVLALAILAAACGDDGDDVARLDNDAAPSLDDIQPEVDPGTSVDIGYATFDGDEANLTDFAGTPLVLNFFAAFCAPCVSEMPEFDDVFEARGGEIAFLGISQDQRADDALELIDRTEITYPAGWDPDGVVYARFGGFAMPTTVFITADGTVAEVFSGALSAEALNDMIDEHLV